MSDLKPTPTAQPTAACGYVKADTQVHPNLSRAEAVRLADKELFEAVNAYEGATAIAYQAKPIDEQKDEK